MKKVLDKVLEWAKQHKKAAIGAGLGCVVLVAVAVLAVLGVTGVIPTGGNIFGSGDITRGEWIKLYGEKFGLVNYDQTEPYYTDVKSDNDAFAYVQTFVENSIMSGEGEAKLDEKISLEEAYIQLSKNYGDNYVKGALGKEELTDKDRVTFLTDKTEVSKERMDKGFSKEVAEELLNKVHEHYLNREFRNVSEIDYAENVIDLSTIKDYQYIGNKLTVSADTELTEGKVLVLGESDEYIAGLAIKITKVIETSKDSNGNNKYELEVTTPELEEVVDRFYVETSQLIDFEGFQPVEGVSIEEVGTEIANTEYKSEVADFNNVLHVEQNELLSVKFNADKKGKFLKLNLNLTEGKVSTTAIWEELGYELDTTKAEGFQYTLDEYGKVLSKYDDSGFEVKGGITLKDLILNGEVEFNFGKLTFDFNAGITAQPSLSMVGNIKGKQIKVGSQEVKICFGCSARVDIYIYVDFEGEITVKPEFVGLVNVKKKAGKSVNTTGKCESNFQSEINCELRVKAGPDVVVNIWGIGDVLDVYAYMGVGADMTYSSTDPLKIVADVYAPTLEAGVSDADNTVLKKMGIKLKVKLIDKEGALFKCPFSARYTYDVLSKNWNSQVGIPDETQGATENETGDSTEAVGSENVSNGGGGFRGDGTQGGGSAEPTTQKTTEKPAEKETTNKVYTLSGASYDAAIAFGTNTYIVEKSGLWGVVDFNGNVKIPIIYEDISDVGGGEYEFKKGDVGYIYNRSTCGVIFTYNKIERINNPQDYKVTYTNAFGGTENLSLNGEMYMSGEGWLSDYYRIEREYNNGMMLEIIPYSSWTGSVDSSGNGYSAIGYLDKFVFKKGNTNTVIASGYGREYISIASTEWWNGIGFSSVTEDNSAIAIEQDFTTGKYYINVVTKNGVKKTEISSEYVPGGANGYSYGWLKDFNMARLINTYTGQVVNMPYEPYAITNLYYGRDDYYAVSTDNGSTYDICKGSKIVSKGWKTVNFSSDKYIIASNSSGEFNYMDYSGNIKLKVKDSGVFFNGKALVYDGTGAYYIDENLNKISDYIYKGSVMCYTNVLKINDKYYLISQ